MSTYWGLRCATCNINTPTEWNHGDDDLSMIVQHWPMLKPVYELCSAGKLWRLNLTVDGWYDDLSPLYFLSLHEGHHIMLHNEYGDAREIEKQVEAVNL